jgi:hypothetical protein
MHFHDYHLSHYTVSEFGNRITLHLVFDYPNSPRRESAIEFSNVAAYHFIHTGGAIITDIEEVRIEDLIRDVGTDLAGWWRSHGGFAYWNDDPVIYRTALETNGYCSWKLRSAIGFSGFVIAKSITQAVQNQSAHPMLARGQLG